MNDPRTIAADIDYLGQFKDTLEARRLLRNRLMRIEQSEMPHQDHAVTFFAAVIAVMCILGGLVQ